MLAGKAKALRDFPSVFRPTREQPESRRGQRPVAAWAASSCG